MTTTNKQANWFDVDRAGLEKLLRRRGVEFAVFELIQNAWDEAGVTRVDVSLQPANERGYAMLTVTDNSANGFADLRHAYTLFAESNKKANAEQRGRFNLGEKLVLAMCKWATIRTTKGTVVFDQDGRSEVKGKKACSDYGSTFSALIKFSADDVAQVATEVRRLISPKGITTSYNDEPLPDWTWRVERELQAQLNTEFAGPDGVLRRTWRNTTVRCYSVQDGEQATIYEMGIPVVTHDCAFHCDVQQKVPLTLDRENVTPRFLEQLRTAVFNATHELLDSEEVNHEWAQTAIESGNAEPTAVRDYMEKRFGELRASYDPNDLEANNKAVANGYTLVHGSMLGKAAWQAARTAEAITSAGKLFPTHAGGFVLHEDAEQTDGMKRVGTYTRLLARLLMGIDIAVEFGEQASREAACYGGCRLQFNVRNLGKGWFDLDNNRLAIDDLIIHEFGHQYEANHLSEKYNDALSRLAAKAMELGRQGKLPQ